MKQKDLAVIIGAVILAAIISVVVSKAIFVKPSSGQQVDIVPSISSSFPKPDSKYFNSKSIDLTQFIKIGNNANTKPFSSAIK